MFERSGGLGAAMLAVVLAGLAAAPAHAAPRVVASVKPIHALVAGVMGDVGVPSLLVPGLSSPHDYAMRPSDAKLLERADLIVWVGPTLESFLVRALSAVPRSIGVLELGAAPGLTRLPIRAGGLFAPDADATESTDGLDGHIWLDPENAQVIVAAVRARLSEIDPPHASDYARNAAALDAELDRLDRELAHELAPVRAKPFIVFHDAYQYLEHRYGLSVAGSITLGVDTSAHAQRLSRMRQRIKEGGAVCVFAEPQFSPALVQTVVEGTRARAGVLDHFGASLPQGPALYFTMMRGLGASLTQCLAPAGG